MTTENIGLFQAMNAKMSYLQQRQKVISQNISNANTPNYKPSDLSELSFGSTLDKVTKEHMSVKKVELQATSASHMSTDFHTPAKVRVQKTTAEVKPDLNAVDVEEQMIKASDVQMNYNLMLNVYNNNMDMIRTSIGRRG